MRRRWILIAIALAALLAVGTTLGVMVLFPPERIDVKVAGPAEPLALRPSIWTFDVRNMGPNIGDLGIGLSGGDGWIAQHTIVRTSAGCQQAAQGELLLCGPLKEGESEIISVTATANAAGSYAYEASFCDCGQNRQIDLLGPNSPRLDIPGAQSVRYLEAWSEMVLPEPTAAITVTDLNGNALSGANVTVEGSSVSATTASTGVARLGLGPLGPGIYTVVATNAGYLNTGAQITIPDVGEPPPTSIQMPWAPPVGTFVWRPKSTLWEVMVISGGNPDYSLHGYDIEWHCESNDWSRTDVTVTLGQDQLTYDGSNIPMAPGKISTSFVRNGALPNTSKPAPAGTCIGGQNAF